MSLSTLTAISPIDGRYYNKTKSLSAYFSEYALVFFRLTVEIRWLESLCNNRQIQELKALVDAQAARITTLESR